jgi:transposase-like protein
MRGRPRNLTREIRVIELLAQGKSAIAIAKEVGIHRNGVYNIRDRNLGSGGEVTEAGAVLAAQQRIEELRRQEAEAQRTREEAEEQAKAMRLRLVSQQAVSRLAEAAKLLATLGADRGGVVLRLEALLAELQQVEIAMRAD